MGAGSVWYGSRLLAEMQEAATASNLTSRTGVRFVELGFCMAGVSQRDWLRVDRSHGWTGRFCANCCANRTHPPAALFPAQRMYRPCWRKSLAWQPRRPACSVWPDAFAAVMHRAAPGQGHQGVAPFVSSNLPPTRAGKASPLRARTGQGRHSPAKTPTAGFRFTSARCGNGGSGWGRLPTSLRAWSFSHAGRITRKRQHSEAVNQSLWGKLPACRMRQAGSLPHKYFTASHPSLRCVKAWSRSPDSPASPRPHRRPLRRRCSSTSCWRRDPCRRRSCP